jgi:hypothetical protein
VAEGDRQLKEAILALLAELPPANEYEPQIFVAFDEAHFLSKPLDGSKGNVMDTSHMAELRRVLEKIRKEPVLTLFLSTTGKISSLVSSYAPDISARLINGTLKLMPAFTDLGYDQLMLEHKIGEGTHKLEEVTGTDFMAKFGRPMYMISEMFF